MKVRGQHKECCSVLLVLRLKEWHHDGVHRQFQQVEVGVCLILE